VKTVRKQGRRRPSPIETRSKNSWLNGAVNGCRGVEEAASSILRHARSSFRRIAPSAWAKRQNALERNRRRGPPDWTSSKRQNTGRIPAARQPDVFIRLRRIRCHMISDDPRDRGRKDFFVTVLPGVSALGGTCENPFSGGCAEPGPREKRRGLLAKYQSLDGQ